MNRGCVNDGGLKSVIGFEDVLRYDEAVEPPPGASAALQSWRARPGEALTVVDGQADCWRARLQRGEGERLMLVPFEKMPRSPESRVRLTVFQALPDKERFELILQKLTELGVFRIVPMVTRRSATREQRDAGQRKSHRWPDVVLKAARQCRRAMIPELADVIDWETALDAAGSSEIGMLLDDGDAGRALSELLDRQKPRDVAVMIGPEGGFSRDEVARAQQRGVVPVSLGPRILRTETAAIAAAAAIQFAVGDLARGK